MQFSNMEKDSLETFNLAGITWAQYKLKDKENKYARRQKVSVYDYTLTEEAVVFVSYSYYIEAGKEEPTLYRDEIQRVLRGFSVTK